MNPHAADPADAAAIAKDAAFFSMHKFAGGPQVFDAKLALTSAVGREAHLASS